MDAHVVMSKPLRSPRLSRPLPLIASAAVLLLLLSALPPSQPYTYEQDVFAINGLYTALGSPTLPAWITNGGDPCNEGWQGVQCVASNITSIVLNGVNLGGQLGNTLGNFTSIVTLDFSNNNIGGTIPDNLPVTMQHLFLSANQLSGSIPSTLSTLTLLTSVSLNNNKLVGEIPDAFSTLNGLANLDFSSNNLTGPLPPSMGNLTALTSMHIQNNQISGTLNVLQDLPLQDLNIESNLFSGPVPVKLLNMPNFKKDGNPFNTSIAPSPSALPPAAPAPLLSVSPPTGHVPSKEPTNSSNAPAENTPSRKPTVSAVKFVGYILIGVVSAVVIALMVMFCLSKYKERKSRDDMYTENQIGGVPQRLGEPKIKEVPEMREPSVNLKNNVGKASNVVSDAREVQKLNMSTAAASNAVYNSREERKLDSSMTAAPGVVTMKQKEHVIDMEKTDNFVEEPLHPPQPVARAEKVIVNPSVRTKKGRVPSVGKMDLTTTVKSFSIASLQQYTNSFSEENLIRDSRFGKIYLAELPDGELLEVLKIDAVNSRIPVDTFLEIVVNISELRHSNILGLVGYCAEFEQRLLVYEHCSKMTLHDELHYVDDSSNTLSWNARLQVAVGAAKALQYLHDCCQPPIVHQNFEPSIVLLNSTLVVHISECGLAALSSKSVSQECEAKFSEIQARYSACDAWFDELRKQRVAELKRELQKSESFIGSLQSMIESLSNSKQDDGNSECRASHTESCSHTENAADTDSSSKELSKDRSSAASFTEEASKNQKSQQVQHCNTDSIQMNNTSAEALKPQVEKKVCANDSLLWGSRKKRGVRDRRILLMADDSGRDGETTSTPCIQRESSSEGCMKKGLKTPTVESGVSLRERAKPNLTEILKTISTQGDCLMLQRQLDIQRKRVRYKKMICRHMDFRILHSKIKSGAISSTKELLRDMLVFVNNVLAFYPKATLEHMAAIELRDLVCKTVQQSSSILSKSCGATGTASAPVVKNNARTLQPGRHGPRDAKRSKVSSREAGSTLKQGEVKDSRGDAPPTANVKTIQKSAPAKKRGVGRPPKGGQKHAGAQQDSPNKGRKKSRR